MYHNSSLEHRHISLLPLYHHHGTYLYYRYPIITAHISITVIPSSRHISLLPLSHHHGTYLYYRYTIITAHISIYRYPIITLQNNPSPCITDNTFLSTNFGAKASEHQTSFITSTSWDFFSDSSWVPQMTAGLRRTIIDGKLQPTLCGSRRPLMPAHCSCGIWQLAKWRPNMTSPHPMVNWTGWPGIWWEHGVWEW